MREFSCSVQLPAETTRIVVGPLAEVPFAAPASNGCLLVEEALEAAHGPALRAFAARAIRGPGPPLVLAGGEAAKDPAAVPALWRQLLARDLDRGSLIVIAGGGALLDACGFAAATFLRGIPVMNVPTTLAGQVDAAIGGKTALDVDGAKNQVGLIRQPACVAADPAFLATLPEPAFRSGLGELAKTALLAGGDLFSLVGTRAAAILSRDPSALADAIELALRFKAAIVARDPLDRGERAILNAGHTAGHVLEAEALRRGIPLAHGEAVAAGLAIEAAAAPRADRGAIARVLAAFRLPERAPFRVAEEDARALLRRDKKRQADVLTMPVIEAPGRAVLVEVPADALGAALAAG